MSALPSSHYTGPLVEYVVPGVDLTFEVAYPLAVTLCKQLNEVEGVFLHVCDRFKLLWEVLLEKEADALYSAKVKALLPKFIEQFKAFWTCLGAYQNKKLINRIAEIRVTMETIVKLHHEIDMMLKEFNQEFADKLCRWSEKNHKDWADQQARMQLMLKAARAMNDGVNDEGVVELLTLLKFEYVQHADKDMTSPRMVMLQEAIDRLMFTSKVIIDEPPTWFIPAYEVQSTNNPMEEGTFGTVCIGTYLGSAVVIKCMMEDTSADRKRFLTEATLWKSLEHPHVIRLFGICHVSKPSFFVSEVAPDGNFADFFKLEEHRPWMWRLFHEAAQGLLFLHDKKIVHGNLKCNNLLVGADKKAKVSDFGFAFHRSASKALSKKAQAEGVRWKSPECLRGENPRFESDVYSFGLCIIEAFTNEVPWGPNADDDDITTAAFEYQTYPRPADMDDSVWSVVEQMVCSDPAHRITMAEAFTYLEQLMDRQAPVNPNECSKCHASLSAEDLFCDNCGHKAGGDVEMVDVSEP